MEDMNRLGLGSVLGLVRVRARVMVRVRVTDIRWKCSIRTAEVTARLCP